MKKIIPIGLSVAYAFFSTIASSEEMKILNNAEPNLLLKYSYSADDKNGNGTLKYGEEIILPDSNQGTRFVTIIRYVDVGEERPEIQGMYSEITTLSDAGDSFSIVCGTDGDHMAVIKEEDTRGNIVRNIVRNIPCNDQDANGELPSQGIQFVSEPGNKITVEYVKRN